MVVVYKNRPLDKKEYLVDIKDNHGHTINVEILKKTVDNFLEMPNGMFVLRLDMNFLNTATHTHILSLNFDQMVELSKTKHLVLDSTETLNHFHKVDIVVQPEKTQF
jgi:hypothetical protein